MDLATVFKLSVYGLTALVGWILGAAEGGWIPFCSLPAVLLGYWWCETRPFHPSAREPGMSNALASVCGFLALSAAGNEFLGDNPEGKLLAGVHLIVYLTWIVLLQHKTTYRYWLLMALGVLQVAVASVLTSGGWFGFCAIGYVFAAIWTLSVFSLYRADQQFAAERQAAPTEEAASGSFVSRSLALGSVQHEAGERWLSMRFVGGVAFTSVAGLIVSALFFALIPRVWVGAPLTFGDEDLPGGLGRRSVSGFSSEVRLGDMGPILESRDPVLDLKLFDQRTGTILLPNEYAERLGQPEPMLRGAVLSQYKDGRWRTDKDSENAPQRLFPKVGVIDVRQEVRLEPTNNDVLFCMGRAGALLDGQRRPNARYQWLTDVAYRGTDWPRSKMANYTVYSEYPKPDSSGVTGLTVSDQARSRYSSTRYLERNLDIPGRLARLVELARRIVRDEQQLRQRRLTDLEAARALEAHLRDSGQYTYSLSLAIQDPGIDPVEDFLFNRRSGHCEYYASALVLMLRAAGIPARLITGYKGGLYDSSSGTLAIEQRFAHAWVEAWIGGRTWVTFDGTPVESRDDIIAAVGANRSLLSSLSSTLSGMWTQNVINISLDRQEEVFYRPLRELAANLWAGLVGLWNSPETSLVDFFKLVANPRNWFSLGGVLALSGLIALGWFARRWLTWLRWPWWTRSQADLKTRRWIEFYERFARLMQTQGLRREPAQTQSEFANQAAATLAIRLRAAGLANVPAQVSELFYRVRFGDETLPDNEALQIEGLLSRLEQALGSASHHGQPG